MRRWGRQEKMPRRRRAGTSAGSLDLINPRVRESIEELYRVFAKYPLPNDTNPCPCCHSAIDDVRLRSKPLRQLSEKDIAQYADDAINVWGDGETYRHF